MEHLISSTEQIIIQSTRLSNKEISLNEFAYVLLSYALLLQQKLSIHQFIPCKLVEGVWVVLEEPSHYLLWLVGIAPDDTQMNECQEFQQAKELCLFEGFYSKNGIVFTPQNQIMVGNIFLEKMTIENIVDLKPKLTPTALKQIGL